jgi:magnesium chelatase family protein
MPDLPPLPEHLAPVLDRVVDHVTRGGARVVHLVGPTGSGKTAIARRVAARLPAPDEHEALGLALIRQSAGLGPLSQGYGAPALRPFRAPHHTCSARALVGGAVGGGWLDGNPRLGRAPRVARAGELTLAHGGVLLLDELPEFRRQALDAVNQALRAGWVHVHVPGVGRFVKLPAAPIVITAYEADPTEGPGRYSARSLGAAVAVAHDVPAATVVMPAKPRRTR